MSHIEGYIIVAHNENEENKFWSIDDNSGGYPYWASDVKYVKIFKNVDEPKNLLIELSNKPLITTMNSNQRCPDRMIHSAIGLNNKKVSGKCTMFIRPIIIGDWICRMNFEGKLENLKD